MKSACKIMTILLFVTLCLSSFGQTFKIQSVTKGVDFNEYSSRSRDYFEELIDVMSKFTITIKEGNLAIVSMDKSDWELLFRFYRNANILKMSQEDYLKVNEFHCNSDIINGINYLEMSVERVSGEISSGEIRFYPEEGLYKPIFTAAFSSMNNTKSNQKNTEEHIVESQHITKPTDEDILNNRNFKIDKERKKIAEINNRAASFFGSGDTDTSDLKSTNRGGSNDQTESIELEKLRQIEIARQHKAMGEEHLHEEKEEIQTTQLSNRKADIYNSGKENQVSGLRFGLTGRKALSLPKPNYPGNDEGIVVVQITVNNSGKVINAKPGARGSTTYNPQLMEAAKQAALKAHFNIDESAPDSLQGTITYRFVLD